MFSDRRSVRSPLPLPSSFLMDGHLICSGEGFSYPRQSPQVGYPNFDSIRRIRKRDRFLYQFPGPASKSVVFNAVIPDERRFAFMRCPSCRNSRTEASRLCLVAAKHTVTVAASSARYGSGRKRRRYAGKAWTGSGLPGQSPARGGWKSHRIPAIRGRCEVEFCEIDFKQAGARRHVGHIVPARPIRHG